MARLALHEATQERLARVDDRIDYDPSQGVVARNRAIEHLLNPGGYLPKADVYPILGTTFLTENLAQRMPEATLLPAEEAAANDNDVSLILGADEKLQQV